MKRSTKQYHALLKKPLEEVKSNFKCRNKGTKNPRSAKTPFTPTIVKPRSAVPFVTFTTAAATRPSPSFRSLGDDWRQMLMSHVGWSIRPGRYRLHEARVALRGPQVSVAHPPHTIPYQTHKQNKIIILLKIKIIKKIYSEWRRVHTETSRMITSSESPESSWATSPTSLRLASPDSPPEPSTPPQSPIPAPPFPPPAGEAK